jgi:hypothetical protein
MKLRHIRKRTLNKFRSNRSFHWEVQKIVKKICKAFDPLDYALKQVLEDRLNRLKELNI